MICCMEDVELTSWPDLVVSLTICIWNHLVTCAVDDAGRTCVLTCSLIDREAEGSPDVFSTEILAWKQLN